MRRSIATLAAVAGDAGFDEGIQLGLRAGPALLRLTLDTGGGSTRRGYWLGSVRGG